MVTWHPEIENEEIGDLVADLICLDKQLGISERG